MPETLLEVTGLKTYFFLPPEIIRAVDVVSFSLPRGETLALVGAPHPLPLDGGG